MKKTLQNVINPTSEKHSNTIKKALENGNSAIYYTEFCTEVASSRSTDYPKFMVTVTDHFFCDYSSFSSIGKTTIFIIPLNQISNIYRSNIVNGKYDFEYFYLALDMLDGSKKYSCRYSKGQRDSMIAYTDLISIIKNKINALATGNGI